MLVIVPQRAPGRDTRNVAVYLVNDYYGSAASERFLKKSWITFVLAKQPQHSATGRKVDYLHVLLLMDGHTSLFQVYL